jgi:ABC-type antimicrobial peptide transport system permease subunit
MYKSNFIAIVSIVAAVTLIAGLAAPSLAQQNMTGMENSTMADGGSTMMMDNSTMPMGNSTMMNSSSTMIMPNNMTRL